MDYKPTLNLTLSDRDPGAMPQRANLPAREPDILAYWDTIDLYRLAVEKAPTAPGDGKFILHDGPPYSNGDIHLGHALNKIAKDIIVKFRTMEGFQAPYVPGWDNHGMPIENEVSKEFRARGETPDKVTMRRRCREYAASFVEKQKAQFQRLGVRGDWNAPYLTMSRDFEATIVGVFGELAEKGFIYRGLKPVLWCAQCETALADAEVEYEDHTSNSIYVRFPVHRDPNLLFGAGDTDPAHSYILIWTTTPWTIPANLALAVHPDAEYAVIQLAGDKYLVARPLIDRMMEAVAPGKQHELYTTAKGTDLEGVVARHPLFERTSPVVMADYVTMEDGTGVVHTAPGHGKEDFETGQRYGLEVLTPVDAAGKFTKQAGPDLEGAAILGGEADRRVIEALRTAGRLMAHSRYAHSYPHCWRCHSPLIFRATVQWFMDIDHDEHRRKAMAAIESTRWYPPVSINRIGSMVANRPDWCLSRQRAWGVGIPAFYCRSCGKEVLSREAITAVADLVRRESSDAWYARPAAEILPPGFQCPHCSCTEFDKETDILDVWFDSGSTNRAVLENRERWPLLRWPADVYLEGSDQHRGWFNSSLMIGVATKGRAPYDAVITNGWTLDGEGRAMHKSLRNVVSPLDMVAKHGADIVRLWAASTDYFADVRCSDEIVSQVTEVYRRVRNTFRFLVNNLYDFDPTRDAVPEQEMADLDRWALAQLDRIVALCREGYAAYEFHRVYHAVNNFCAVELSAFYLDVLKDRLYCDGKTWASRRSAQTALYRIAHTLARLLAPILSFTAEEVWQHLGRPDTSSPQLAALPEARPDTYTEVLRRWEPVLGAREHVNLAVEAARQEKRLANPLDARVEIGMDEQSSRALTSVEDVLPAVFKVSQVHLTTGGTGATGAFGAAGVAVTVCPATDQKCARCWLYKADVGSDGRYPDVCARCARAVRDFTELAGERARSGGESSGRIEERTAPDGP